jgi:hypothetical protein
MYSSHAHLENALALGPKQAQDAKDLDARSNEEE